MPCDGAVVRAKTELERMRLQRQRAQALKLLEIELGAKRVTVVVDKVTGAVAFKGWQGRGGWSDVCAYRKLQAANSWPLRLAVQAAEQAAGRQVSEQAVASGLHSHNGGETWGRD